MNKKYSLIFVFIIISTVLANAQTFNKYKSTFKSTQQRHGQISLIGGIGLSTYVGDLKESKIDIDARPNILLGVKYRYRTQFSLRGELSWYKIGGADSLQTIESGLPSRNLSFKANNFEINISGILHAFPRYKTSRDFSPQIINPYVFLGIGASTNNPTTQYEQNKYNLRKLNTQGVPYSGVVLVVPLGIGIDFRINDKFDIGIEGGYRIAFTDQLDDASNPNYIDRETISNPIARALSDRRGEVGIIPGAPIGAGAIRGNPTANDGYFLLSIKGQYYLPMAGLRRAKYQDPIRRRR